MRKYAILLLVALVALSGCAPAPKLAVILESPTNGSSVSSLTPILAWNCSETGASFRLQLASDSNFQNLIIDESNLGSPSYTIASGKITKDETYYWKVNATKGGQTSGWSTYWSFKTPTPTPPPPATGTIVVNATLDGSSWSGSVNYNVTGPKADSGSSAPQTFSNLPTGSYAVSYGSGGPAGATLADITPSVTQTLSADSTITFTFNFQTKPTTIVMVNATLDGSPWSGLVNYNIQGPKAGSSSSVPDSFSDVPAGSYNLSYSSGGPSGTTLTSITPSSSQTVSKGSTITFTLNFHTQAASTIRVKATLDGSLWSGNVRYTINGPYTDSAYSAPQTFNNLPAGTYTINYSSGGPSGAALTSITPSPTQTVSEGGNITFYLNFHRQATTGAIVVQAVLDGSSWAGQLTYTMDGPRGDHIYSVPQTFSNLPPGTYTIGYRSGGPAGATLVGITPSPVQHLSPGGTIAFTFNFHSQATTGTITVQATLDGSPWSGQLDYVIHGPKTDSSYSVPESFSNLPTGTYTMSYRSGGPAGAVLANVTPATTQNLPSGGTITFTLNFHRQAATGTIRVNATLDGKPWQTAIGSGTISYSIRGPKTDSSSSIPETFTNCPAGTYTLSYRSGGPTGATLANISPSSRQNLSPGGTITFTLNFHGQAKGTVLVNATLNGRPWSGAVRYTVAGPYVDSHDSAPGRFPNCPAGSYSISYTSGGPPQSILEDVTPSPTQNLSPGSAITFTLNFRFQGGVLK